MKSVQSIVRRTTMGVKSNSPRRSEQHQQGNIEAARLILTDVDKYGGEEALAVRWARRFLASGNYSSGVIAA